VLNLVPMVLDRLARGERPTIFGDDYPTPDGTCIRDYIHVLDLAHAHLAALDHLDRDEHPAAVFNVGTGRGASVREVIEEIGRVSGLDVTADVVARRAGDPPRLVASPDRIAEVLGWRAANGLPEIIASAWEAWQTGPRRVGGSGRSGLEAGGVAARGPQPCAILLGLRAQVLLQLHHALPQPQVVLGGPGGEDPGSEQTRVAGPAHRHRRHRHTCRHLDDG